MDFFLHLVCTIAIALPAQLGYTLVFGKGKLLNFGPIGVSVVCAYAGILSLKATGSFSLAIAMSVAFGIGMSALYAWLSFRLEPDGLGVATLAAHLGLVAVVLNWSSLTRGALGIPQVPRLPIMETQAGFAAVSTIVCVAWIVFFLWLERTPFARRLCALAEHDWHAKSLGVSAKVTHLLAMVILGLTLASDNFFYPQYYRLLHPNDYHFPAFVSLLMITVAGKPGSVAGASIATVLLMLLKDGVRFLPLPTDVLGPVRLLLFGLILLVAVWYRRDTLFPKKRTI